MSSSSTTEDSILDKLDAVPQAISKFDAFPKVPSAYKARSESRGFMTVFVAFMAFFLLLNDVSDFIWGWTDYEFSVDNNKSPFMKVNVDMTVAMPCGCQFNVYLLIRTLTHMQLSVLTFGMPLATG